MRHRISIAAALVASLVACAGDPGLTAPAGPPKPDLQFVDLQGFDRDLGQSLSVPLPRVEVAFYDRVTPSALPERLQQWMAAVESKGGKVTVLPPPQGAGTRSPFLLISALSSLWTASRVLQEMAAKAQYRAAEDYDAEIVLKLDGKGEPVVHKVAFIRRKV